jgi:hypothetical protein
MKRNIIPIVLLESILLFGCSYPHFYNTPVAQNVPLNDTSMKFTGLFAGSFGAVNPCFEGQASFSFPANLALAGSFMTGGTTNRTGDAEDYSKVNYFEGEFGFYKPFSKICVFELYAGYGQGSQNHMFAYNEYSGSLVWTWVADGQASINYSQIFIQPVFGVSTNWFEIAVSSRLSRVNYDDVTFSGTKYRILELTTLKSAGKLMFLEPAFTVRVGSPAVKFQLQIVLSSNFTDQNIPTDPLRVNFGFHFTLGGKHAQKINPAGSTDSFVSGK